MDDFQNKLDYEKGCQQMADVFYKEHMNAISIERYDWDDPEGRRMQKRDADCKIVVKSDVNENDFLHPIVISEKFRSMDWGDMWIELYSRYPSVKGWALESQGVDLIAYFIDGLSAGIDKNIVYLVNAKRIKEFAENIVKQFDNAVDIKIELEKTGKYNAKYDYNGKQYDVIFRKVKTQRPTYSYDGVGVCIKWNDLKEMGVNITKKTSDIDMDDIDIFDLE